MKNLILIAEDDANIRQGLQDALEADGYRVICAEDGEEAVKLCGREKPGLVILDIMMPKMDGYEVCRRLRKNTTVPILFLSAKGEEIDKVVGLELGGDDYLTKPFGLAELRARVAALLRRADNREEIDARALPDEIRFGPALVDRKRYRAIREETEYPLTATEMRVLELFYLKPDTVLSRDDLLNGAWGLEFSGGTRTVDQTVSQLRKKFEADPSDPKTILTIHGVGYRYSPGGDNP